MRRGTLLVIPCGRALLYAEPIYLQAERSPMPELRLVVLALQDRLAYGPTFESAMNALYGGEASSLSTEAASLEPERSAGASAGKSASDLKALISGAAKDLEDYQRLTAAGKLGEAGQKLQAGWLADRRRIRGHGDLGPGRDRTDDLFHATLSITCSRGFAEGTPPH